MAAKRKTKRKLPADLAEAEILLHSASSGASTNRESNQALRSVDLCQVQGVPTLEQFHEDDIATWLVARYGVQELRVLCTALSALPNTLVSAQKMRYFKEFTGRQEDASSLCNLIEKCPTLISACSAHASPATRVLAPPVSQCFVCSSNLVENHHCRITIYATSGATSAEKVTLRCVKCSLTYNYSRWGNKRGRGFLFYQHPREFVEVNDVIFYERRLLELQCSLA